MLKKNGNKKISFFSFLIKEQNRNKIFNKYVN